MNSPTLMTLLLNQFGKCLNFTYDYTRKTGLPLMTAWADFRWNLM